MSKPSSWHSARNLIISQNLSSPLLCTPITKPITNLVQDHNTSLPDVCLAPTPWPLTFIVLIVAATSLNSSSDYIPLLLPIFQRSGIWNPISKSGTWSLWWSAAWSSNIPPTSHSTIKNICSPLSSVCHALGLVHLCAQPSSHLTHSPAPGCWVNSYPAFKTTQALWKGTKLGHLWRCRWT